MLRHMQQPAVPRPTEPIIRTEAVRKHTRHGCVFGSAEFVAARVSVAGAAIDVAAKRAATAAKFWARHLKAVLAAETALEEHGGDLSKVIKVGDLKALIISRTGRTVKAKTSDGRDALRAGQRPRGACRDPRSCPKPRRRRCRARLPAAAAAVRRAAWSTAQASSRPTRTANCGVSAAVVSWTSERRRRRRVLNSQYTPITWARVLYL